jgi:hypothetical protein
VLLQGVPALAPSFSADFTNKISYLQVYLSPLPFYVFWFY